MTEVNYLESLNPLQYESVCSTEGPNLIIAGAGTGKTKVLTTRVAHIIDNNLAFPSQILCVTFTNKACLLYTSPSPRDPTSSRMPSSA